MGVTEVRGRLLMVRIKIDTMKAKVPKGVVMN